MYSWAWLGCPSSREHMARSKCTSCAPPTASFASFASRRSASSRRAAVRVSQACAIMASATSYTSAGLAFLPPPLLSNTATISPLERYLLTLRKNFSARCALPWNPLPKRKFSTAVSAWLFSVASTGLPLDRLVSEAALASTSTVASASMASNATSTSFCSACGPLLSNRLASRNLALASTADGGLASNASRPNSHSASATTTVASFVAPG
mmetsp:Transcript_3598/g.22574  ORF Transcript_3598/g.22574 Transcript_3598/m.22574 type:complete len:211 (+) Transcript_3598:1804-2436(+)